MEPIMVDVLVPHPESAHIRARIHRLNSAGFRIDIERLIDEDDAGGNKRGEFWSAMTGLTSYADTEERAKLIATENLANAAWRPAADV
jgi:hypothetical protein